MQTLDAKLFPPGSRSRLAAAAAAAARPTAARRAPPRQAKVRGPGIKRKGCLQPVKGPAAAAAASMPPPASPSAPPPELARTASVVYLETSILPAVRACHTAAYLERLHACGMHTRALKRPRNQGRSRATCRASRAGRGASKATPSPRRRRIGRFGAALAACKAVDAVCRGDAANAFAAIRPPGHHCGRDGSTAGPASFAGWPCTRRRRLRRRRRGGGRRRRAATGGARLACVVVVGRRRRRPLRTRLCLLNKRRSRRSTRCSSTRSW